MSSPIPLSSPQLRDGVMDHVKRLIVLGDLHPGSAIPLSDLAEDLGISLTPVREGLLLLSREGWITQQPNRGFRVAPLHRQDIADAYLVNAFVMGELGARAADWITVDELAHLGSLDRELRKSPASEQQRITDLNYRFHSALNAAARSPRLRWFSVTTSRLDPRVYWTTIPEWLAYARGGHRRILDALTARDSQLARQLMVDHVEGAGRFLLADMDRRGFWDQPGERRRRAPAKTRPDPPTAAASTTSWP